MAEKYQTKYGSSKPVVFNNSTHGVKILCALEIVERGTRVSTFAVVRRVVQTRYLPGCRAEHYIIAFRRKIVVIERFGAGVLADVTWEVRDCTFVNEEAYCLRTAYCKLQRESRLLTPTSERNYARVTA
jgi:hypothetical protein